MTETLDTSGVLAPAIGEEDWLTSGWVEDVRPALRAAADAGRAVTLATLFKQEGSAPRGPGAQMLFDGDSSVGFFSGGCIESDVAQHAAEVAASGEPRVLHYGTGSPWRDIKLRCGGAIHIFVERVDTQSAAVRGLLDAETRRESVLWVSDGHGARVEPAGDAPLLTVQGNQPTISRRYDPAKRLIVSGWDPTALAIAKLGVEAGFETFVVRPYGPDAPPPIEGVAYLRTEPAKALRDIGGDAWTAFVGASHESDLDIPACATALKLGAGYVGLIGAASRLPERLDAIAAAGAPADKLMQLRAPAGITSLGKAPWRIAVGVIAEILQTMNKAQEVMNSAQARS
jgi:xanthine dehydrogenase accessory factor